MPPLVDKQVADAWNEYLAQTRALPDVKRDEVEEWAWKVLQGKLKEIRKRANAKKKSSISTRTAR